MARSQELYEQLAHYPRPPMIPLPDLKKIDLFQELELAPAKSTLLTLRFLMKASGFSRFARKDPQEIESLLRRVNTRGPALFAFAVSATLIMQDDPRPLSPFQRAATLIMAAYQLYHDLMDGSLPPDKYGEYILEMGQYSNLFSSSIVIDGAPRLFKSERINQLTVLCGSRMYLLTIADTTKLRVAHLAAELETLASYEDKTGPSIGLLSAASDGVQLRAFNRMRKMEENRKALDSLKHSFVTLCLDLDKTPDSDAQAARLAHFDNPDNRWYHQSLQLVVFGNSKAAAICHFSAYLDGNTMMRGAAEIQRRAQHMAIEDNVESMTNVTIQPLQWRIRQRAIEYANRDHRLISWPHQSTFVLTSVGADNLRIDGGTPVQIFITALALTLKQILGAHVRISQFLTMSKYRCMDLTTATVSTPEVQQCVEAVIRNDNKENVLSLLRRAVASQQEICRQRRRQFPLHDLFNLYRRSLSGMKRRWVDFLAGTVLYGMRKRGVFLKVRRQVVVSHPAIYPGVTLVGRPGTILPYVQTLGLHYQIWPDRITVIYMPGRDWKDNLHEFTRRLEHSLLFFSEILNRSTNGNANKGD